MEVQKCPKGRNANNGVVHDSVPAAVTSRHTPGVRREHKEEAVPAAAQRRGLLSLSSHNPHVWNIVSTIEL
jgi:hypothetical protein